MVDYLVVNRDGSYEAVSSEREADRAAKRDDWLCNIPLGVYRLGVRAALLDEITKWLDAVRLRIADNAQAVREKYGDHLSKERLKEIDDMLCGQRHGIAEVNGEIRKLRREG